MENDRPSQYPTALYWSGWIMVLCAAVYYFSFVTADPDLWGHIRFGRDLWRSGRLPATDPYAFTNAGHTWINHEWAAELLFYHVYALFGDAGLLLGKLCFGILTTLGVYAASRARGGDEHPLIRFGGLIMLITALSPGYMIRPQLFSFLFFSLELLILYRYLERGENQLWLLPLLMALWVNMHGGFLMGWVVLVAACACHAAAAWLSSDSRPPVRALVGWTAAASLATVINPYGCRLHAFLIGSLSVSRDITEWRSLPVGELSYTNIKLMMILVPVLMWRYRRELRLWESVIVLMTMTGAIVHQRHVPFFGMAATPFLMQYTGRLVTDIRSRLRPMFLERRVWLPVAAAMGVLAMILFYRGAERYALSGFRIVVDPMTYPVTSVSFLKKNGFQGNLILPFDWGEYAIWKLYPKCRVSIDGRFRTAYPESVIRDHFIHHGDVDGWRHLLNTYRADLVLAVYHPKVAEYLKSRPGWVYVYSDSRAMVFVHRNGANAAVLERFFHTGLDYSDLEHDFTFP